MAGHVFISHSTRDDKLVGRLRSALERLGFSTWTDSRQLTAGDQLEEEIRQAIVGASHLVAVISMHAVNSPWVRKEIALGLEQVAARAEYKVIPLLIPPLEVASLGLFFPVEPVALRFDDKQEQVSDLLARLRNALGDSLPSDPEITPQPVAAPLAELTVELRQLGMVEKGCERRATALAKLIWQAPGAEAAESQDFRLTSPLGPIDAGELAWYLERYAIWPGAVFRRRAVEVEENLLVWGKRLFETLDTEPTRKVWEAFRKVPARVERCISIHVDPDPPFGSSDEEHVLAREAATLWLGLPWELLRDGQGLLAEGAHGTRVRRRMPHRAAKEPLVTATPIRVLVVSPRPEDDMAGYIDHRISARPLVEAFARLGDRAEVELLGKPTLGGLGEALRVALEQGRPFHAVHFDGHGVYDKSKGLGALCFEDPADQDKLEKRRSQIVDAETLASTLREHRVPLVVLEACESAAAKSDPMTSVAGRLLEGGVASVVAMSHSVLVETAWRFVDSFYGRLSEGATVGKALLEAQRRLREDSARGRGFHGELRMHDWFVPVLYQETLDPQLVRQLPGKRTGEEILKLWAAAVEGLPESPEHGFVGRSRQMLAVERLLLRERYAVLLGEGGEGKTTLAVELAHWLVKAQRFDKAAFVSVEDTLTQSARAVLSKLGGQLVVNFDAATGADFERGRQEVERALRERPTLLLLDNLESLLGSDGISEPEVLDEVLKLLDGFAKVGDTRLLFTSRSALPAPFAQHVVRLGRLGKDEAIALVGKVLEAAGAQPAGEESEKDVEELVEAAGCHARSLTLLTREVATSGVRGAAQRMGALMASMAERYPDDRERSLFASVELSLRRLPPEMREKLGPLGVFQVGGQRWVLARVLGLDYEKNEEVELGNQLVKVGLAEWMPYGHLRLHPALGPALLRELSEEDVAQARALWVEGMVYLTMYLYGQIFEDAQIAANLTLLELPNLIALLDNLRSTAEAERVVAVATSLEKLVQRLGRPKALARVVQLRVEAVKKLGDWSHARFEAESAAIDRLHDAGRFGQALQLAEQLKLQAIAVGESAYAGALYDLGAASLILGRALRAIGSAAKAFVHLQEARERFSKLTAEGDEDAEQMVAVCWTESGNCLRVLGRLEEAAQAYLEAIGLAKKRANLRQIAVGKGQLGTVRMLQRRYAEALSSHSEARQIFEDLGELVTAAGAWHQIGVVHEQAGQLDAAENAYQRSLAVQIQQKNRSGEALALGQLGNLYSRKGRLDESVRFYRDAAIIFADLDDRKSAGVTHSNLADRLIKLGRYAEARGEIARAIECKERFGHAVEPWRAFHILHDLERAVGDVEAAAKARQQAIDVFLAYRRDGGENHSDHGRLVAMAGLAIATGQVDAISAELDQFACQVENDVDRRIIAALQEILAGSRDLALAEDPEFSYKVVAELRFLLKVLSPTGSA